MRAIWITWERQRRNKSMAAELGVDLYELHSAGGRLKRYLALTIQTIRLLATQKPDIVFYQNPSLALAALIAIAKKTFLRKTTIIGDYHNAGVYPPVLPQLTQWIARSSNLILVSNQKLVDVVKAWGADAMAVPDPIPDIHAAKTDTCHQKAPLWPTILFICSWADDEPVAEVVDAAEQLVNAGVSVEIKITGRPKWEQRCGQRTAPNNVTLTHFLSDEAFDHLLRTAYAVIDLTTRDNCMVCGAYEAVAAERPMILSDNEATREYFFQGAVYTDNSATSIKACILQILDEHSRLSAEVRTLKNLLLTRQSELAKAIATRTGLPQNSSHQ